MPLEPFIPQRKHPRKPATVTIRTDGRFAFNVEASRIVAAFPARRVVLFGDKDTKRVEMRPAAGDPSLKSIRVTVVSLSNSSVRVSFEGAAFLDWIGCDYSQQPHRFALRTTDTILFLDATSEIVRLPQSHT